MAKEITSREEDYSKWYLDIVNKAGLASNSKVGCYPVCASDLLFSCGLDPFGSIGLVHGE